MSERVKTVERDGQPLVQLQCPGCGVWGDLDDDQYVGKVSVICPECGHHETRNWMKEAEE